ncbi:hypothetical protein ONS95_005929 [Cadophora gregata]|uniref:uncharacterized protein n=1 Tax=Cadophora gregata TaxID=51156 RepID=UPI0026DB859D|nr:uncharacterized protein ONS95_005929 [Cadophora gregata]KAK0102306.1 hypothetical protein ONS95_005929 [Cadophora gregata]KAK0103934.1 hypothetical protein ONS96_005041 [Cadophora gregata f. sp. sojae]
MSMAKSLKRVGKVTMSQVQSANGSLGVQWLSALNIAEQTVVTTYPQIDAIQIAGAKAHQSYEVAAHSNIISVKFFAGSKRIMSAHVHLNGKVDYSKPTHGSSSAQVATTAGAGHNAGGGESSSSHAQGATTTELSWRTNEQTKRAEWWNGVGWVEGEWSYEHQRWYAYYNGEWYYW